MASDPLDLSSSDPLFRFEERSTSVLQDMMNPSEPFIADDTLDPWESYSMPARKELPDLTKYLEDQEKAAAAQKQRRRRKLPRFGVNILFGSHAEAIPLLHAQ